ncbi:rhodanese-like domain-containing protein [Rhizomicrobium electricum]|uniref:Rhodanese-like domain-containing protein n=2 Tax=Rhizomicrobium electricum TaxID=480070 RepID=A0ABP3PQ34_9PROT
MGLSSFLRDVARLWAQSQEKNAMTLKNLEPAEVADLLGKNEIMLIDVREPAEYASAHIKGAVLVPLSQFDPHTLPGAGQKRIVLHCGVGGRSARAVAACQAAGIAVDSHMRGGIQAWMAAGLPVER